MKKNLHPSYNAKSVVTCACGNTFETGSTKDNINTELCNLCHPYFTGTQKIIDTARRVEKFEARKKLVDTDKKSKKEKLAEKRAKREEKKKAEIEKIEE